MHEMFIVQRNQMINDTIANYSMQVPNIQYIS